MLNKINMKSILLLLLAASLYSLIFPINLSSLENGATIFGNTFWQTMIGGTLLLIISLIKEQKKFTFYSRKSLKCYLIVGAFGFGFPLALFTTIGNNLPVFLTSIVMALSPTFTYFLSVLLKREKLSYYGFFGIFLGLVGVVILLTPEKIIPNGTVLFWFLIALIVPFFYAIANMSASILIPKETNVIMIGAGYLLGASSIVLPLMFFSGQFYLPIKMELFLLATAGGVVNAFFIILFVIIIKNYGPTFFSQFNYLAVIFAIFWASIFFSQSTPLIVFLSLLIMAFGIIVSQLTKKN